MTCKLKCKIKNGLFDNEYAILAKDLDGRVLETWADKSQVEPLEEVGSEEWSEGFVEVLVLKSFGEYLNVLLPNETYVGHRVITVSGKSVKFA